MYNAFHYVVANNGVDSQNSYPFQGRVRQRRSCGKFENFSYVYILC